jgi:AcrR family transcriptional regulator
MASPTTKHSRDTKERILDAAERLFVEQGFDSASMRGITAEAGVNLAAVNYHFGSKDALVAAVLERRIGPLNQERAACLDRLELDGLSGRESLEAVVAAFVAPALRLSADPVAGATVMRLVGHAINLHGPLRETFIGQFRGTFERFSAAIGRCLPELPEQEVVWRMLFMIGAMAHTLALSNDLEHVADCACDVHDTETVSRRLVAFLSAGLAAPPAAVEEGV